MTGEAGAVGETLAPHTSFHAEAFLFYLLPQWWERVRTQALPLLQA